MPMQETVTRRESRREEILAAAIRCFSARGFEGASTREIAREAAVKQPLIFYHFGSKADLYLASVFDQLQRLKEGLDAALAVEQETLTQLRVFVQVYYDFFTVLEPGLTVCLRELSGLPGRLADQISQAHHTCATGVLEQIIGDGMADGVLRPLDAGACALAMIGILHVFLRLRPRGSQRFSLEMPVRQVLDVYCAGLLAHPQQGVEAASGSALDLAGKIGAQGRQTT